MLVHASCIRTGLYNKGVLSGMAVLGDDLFKRGRSVAKKSVTFGIVHGVLIAAAGLLLLLARFEHPLAFGLQRNLDLWGARPISWARHFMAPSGIIWERTYLAVAGDFEVARLREENLNLRSMDERAQQDRARIEELQQLAMLVGPSQRMPLLVARVLAGANGYFGQSLLLQAGCRHGLDVGYAVYSSGGLIGRIVAVTEETARVRLLSDAQTFTHVVVGKDMHRAILAGAGGDLPRLTEITQSLKIKNGDLVVTSGIGGLFEAGLRIGRVVETEGGLRVQIIANRQKLRYVAIERHGVPMSHTVERSAGKYDAVQRCRKISEDRRFKLLTGARLNAGATSR